MRDRTLIQQAAFLFGITYIVVAVAGFIPGLTTDFDELTAFDHEGAQVFGIFGVNVVENLIHALYGVAGLALAATAAKARSYFLAGGAVLLVVWVYGLVIDLDSAANFIGVNEAGNWLHFVLGTTMVAIALLLGREERGLSARPGT